MGLSPKDPSGLREHGNVRCHRATYRHDGTGLLGERGDEAPPEYPGEGLAQTLLSLWKPLIPQRRPSQFPRRIRDGEEIPRLGL